MSFETVYGTYVAFCERIGVQPASYETWVSLQK